MAAVQSRNQEAGRNALAEVTREEGNALPRVSVQSSAEQRQTAQGFLSPLARPFDFPEGRHGVLLIHGFTGSPAHMRLIGEGLKERGFAVRGILLPGHGTDPRDMERVTWQDWWRAAVEAAEEMREKYAYFTVAGLSMGGLMALMLAAEMPVTACVSIAAPVKTVNRLRGLAPLLAPVHPVIRKQGERTGLIPAYDVGYDEYPTCRVQDLNVLIGKCRQCLPRVRCPLLVIQSHGDRTVAPDSPEIILSRTASPVTSRLWLQEAPHACTASPEYPKIVEAMADFLQRCE